jgi:hypothetical protein
MLLALSEFFLAFAAGLFMSAAESEGVRIRPPAGYRRTRRYY